MAGDVLLCKRLGAGVFCRPNPRYKKPIRLSGSEFAQFFEGLNISGKILESTPSSRSNKKRLLFVQPYRKLSPDASGGGIKTGASQASTSVK
jgi:hypothetical protein